MPRGPLSVLRTDKPAWSGTSLTMWRWLGIHAAC